MNPSVNKLRSINPLLVWSSDEEIKKLTLFLKEKGFSWINDRKIFHNERLDSTINVKEFKGFIDNYESLEKKIEKSKKENKKEEFLGNIKIAGALIDILIFLITVNLFLGWVFLHFFLWIIIEVLLISFLLAMIKLREKIKSRLTKEVYIFRE